MFWMTLLKGILKRPWIIALIVMGVLMGGMWININVLKGDIVDLRTEIVRVEKDFGTCKNNELGILTALEEQNGSITSLNTIITALQEQVVDEQELADKWEWKYEHRPVIKTVKEVPTIIYVDGGVVVDEESSKEYVDYFNVLFSD
jgi:hypothetical protein